jgi:RNase P subunit RPR2
MDLYCVKCKTRTSTNDVTTITTSNNRSALTGKCAICGIKKFRFTGKNATHFQKKNEEVILQPN